MFVSTHLISEFEGLIDEFTIIDGGRDVLTLDADAARERYQKIYARFAHRPAGRSRRRARPAAARPRPRGRRQRQRGGRAWPAAGAVARDADDRVADARGDLRHHIEPDGTRAVSAASPVAALVFKEVRATWLVFAGCFVVMVLPHAIGRGNFDEPAYLLGSALLGALAIGHGYSNGTLVQALAQPIRRAHLLATKLAVLAVMLSALGAAAWFSFNGRTPGMTASGRLEFLLMPLLVAFCVSPWLTMVSRGPTGGAVFSFGLPGLLWSGTLLTYYAVYRREPSAAFALAASWRGGLALCAIGAVMTWRTFLRLEAIDGRGAEIQLPQFRSATTTARRQHPVWALIVKDFRLQQMTLAFAALYCVAWPVCALVGGSVLEAFNLMSIVYAVLVALLSGSLSSAEERQLGTFDTQMLLPVPASTQWTSKVLVALTFTLLLGIGLPYVFMTLASTPGVNSPRPSMFLASGFVTGLVAIMSAGFSPRH